MLWVRDELMKMMELEGDIVNSAMLLAYLGYQTGTPKMVRYALDMAASQSPDDPLVIIARRAWLKEKPEHQPDTRNTFEPDFQPDLDRDLTPQPETGDGKEGSTPSLPVLEMK